MTSPSILRSRLFVALVALLALSVLTVAANGPLAHAAPDGYRFTQVAELPQPAPGIPGKYLVRNFQINSMNESGGVLFGAPFASTGYPCVPGNCSLPFDGEGIWTMKRNSSPELIVKYDDLDPDGESFYQSYSGPAAINSSGDAAFTWWLLPSPIGHSNAVRMHAGVYRYDAARKSLGVIAKTGSPAPGGGTFAGSSGVTSMNSRGEVVFSGITESPLGTVLIPATTVDPNFPQYAGKKFGAGLYVADRHNDIAPVVVPGDPSPRGVGGKFVQGRNPFLNDRGDVAFGGRTTLDGACAAFACSETAVYVRWAGSGITEALVGVGDVAPVPPYGTKTFKTGTWGAKINNQGEVIFVGYVDDPYTAGAVTRGLFLVDDGEISAIAYPGQSLIATNGDAFDIWRVSNIGYNYFITNNGKIVFSAQYMSDTNSDGVRDSGVFVWDGGTYTVVAKTGDDLPGIGEIREIAAPEAVAFNSGNRPTGGVHMTSGGMVVFQAVLDTGKGSFIVATPGN